MAKEKIGVKYTVRSAIVGLYTLLLVVGYQNCSLYQSDIGGTSDDPSTKTPYPTKTTDTTETTGNPNINCDIVALSNGGTKTQTNNPNHKFLWNVADVNCVVEARLNNGNWQLCDAQNTYGCKVSAFPQHSYSVSQYDTYTLDVRTSSLEGDILDQQQATVTIEEQPPRPRNCKSYLQCETARTRADCSCEPKLQQVNGYDCYQVKCEDDEDNDDEDEQERPLISP